MKLKTKAIENYMALGGAPSPSFTSLFIFLHGVPVPGVCLPKILPMSSVWSLVVRVLSITARCWTTSALSSFYLSEEKPGKGQCLHLGRAVRACCRRGQWDWNPD